MAGSFSSKKVSRAARTGGRTGGRFSANFGFYSILALIAIVGTTLVVVSRNERLSPTDYGSTPPLAPIAAATEGAAPTRAGDRWFEAYGVYTCDKFAPSINSENNPYGISTSNDGVIHITPYERKYAGHNSNLGLFAKAVEFKLDRTGFTLPGDKTTYTTGVTKCAGKDAELVVKEWTDATKDSTGKIVAGDPKTILLKDKEAIVVAFVPKGDTTIPLPPSAATLATVASTDAAQVAAANSGSAAPTDTTAPAATTATTAAPAITPTTAAAK